MSVNLNQIQLDWGDCIGMESFVDLKSDFTPTDSISKEQVLKMKGGGRKKEAVEYPPPLHHNPWAMKRCTTTDGRLIIKEDKIHGEDYFRALRSNGRLTLSLVPFEDEDEDDHAGGVDDATDDYDSDDDDDDEDDELATRFSGLRSNFEKGESSTSSSSDLLC